MKAAIARGWSVKSCRGRLHQFNREKRGVLPYVVTFSRPVRVALVPLREYRRLRLIDRCIRRLGGLELLRLAKEATKETRT